jgi:pimeloyl-ACP methyl ester carboxylesterase
VRTSDGVELRVVDHGGAGPEILLLHGLMGRASTWRAVARWLSRIDDVAQIAAEWATVDHWAALDAVRCPVLLLEAEQSVAPPGQMGKMAQRLADAHHVRVPGTGHLLHAAALQAYRSAVDGFLAL